MDMQHVIAWGIFVLVILGMLALDLFVFHRKPHAIQLREALLGATVPVFAAAIFFVAIYFAYGSHYLHLGTLPPGANPAHYPSNGPDAAFMFLTGYIVELSLSADNVFLFVILMSFFSVPQALQHRVLFWGVLGALVMRAAMILGGAVLLSRFEWVIYLFGVFLLFAGVKMFFSHEPKDPSDNFAIRALRKIFPIHDGYDGKKFFTRIDGKRFATTLFLVLACIEFTDLVFALDSIPAIFGITRDPFLVFTSNVFAILGLRSMYFLLAGVMDKFHLLRYGLAAVLSFVGVKMLLPGVAQLYGHYSNSTPHWEIDRNVSLAVIVLCLSVSVAASLIFPCKTRHQNPLAERQPHPRPPRYASANPPT